MNKFSSTKGIKNFRLSPLYVALLLSLGSAATADVLVTTSPVVTGAEDTSIPLGLSIDPALLAGGSQLDVIGTDVGFRDAAAGATTVDFTIPANTDFATAINDTKVNSRCGICLLIELVTK